MDQFKPIIDKLGEGALNDDIYYNLGGQHIDEIYVKQGVRDLTSPHSEKIKDWYYEINNERDPNPQKLLDYFVKGMRKLLIDVIMECLQVDYQQDGSAPRTLSRNVFLKGPPWQIGYIQNTAWSLGFHVYTPKLKDSSQPILNKQGEPVLNKQGEPRTRQRRVPDSLLYMPHALADVETVRDENGNVI